MPQCHQCKTNYPFPLVSNELCPDCYYVSYTAIRKDSPSFIPPIVGSYERADLGACLDWLRNRDRCLADLCQVRAELYEITSRASQTAEAKAGLKELSRITYIGLSMHVVNRREVVQTGSKEQIEKRTIYLSYLDCTQSQIIPKYTQHVIYNQEIREKNAEAQVIERRLHHVLASCPPGIVAPVVLGPQTVYEIKSAAPPGTAVSGAGASVHRPAPVPSPAVAASVHRPAPAPSAAGRACMAPQCVSGADRTGIINQCGHSFHLTCLTRSFMHYSSFTELDRRGPQKRDVCPVCNVDVKITGRTSIVGHHTQSDEW